METLSFTLGVLSVIVVAFVAVLVWGIVKVVKQQKQINNINQQIEDSHQTMWRVREDDSRNQREKERSIEMYLDKRFIDLESTIQDLHRRIDSAMSYTDSRIDKLIEANKPKQLIKG